MNEGVCERRGEKETKNVFYTTVLAGCTIEQNMDTLS